MMRGAELLAWIASQPAIERDREVDAWLGIAEAPPSTAPGDHLVGYHPSGVDSILEAAREVPITARDVVLDLGAGLGKVALLIHLATGARARGIEIQPALVERARRAAARQGATEVSFDVGDARSCDLGDANVFFMYLPFTGPALLEVLARLERIARERAIVVCTLGLDLERHAPWLRRRPLAEDVFWLAVYDSC
ncbi:MAG: class I SAM-dependent methyltransferase [Deltaproteobacteria bacterium]|nr:class I SAM-dependent methyltransferase [Deltaproteobacteria bacterium]